MRLIDGDALVYELTEMVRYNTGEFKYGIEAARIAAMEALTIGGWISVEDRLPENKIVLVSVITKNTGHRWETPIIGEIVHGKWFLETEGTIADNVDVTVTHWMPLPSTEGLDET